MTTFPGSPRLVKAGIVLLDPSTAAIRRIIGFQYNPDQLSRTLQVQAYGGEGGDRSQALRVKGPPVEQIRVEAELDATDQLEVADGVTTEVGLGAQLAALETMIYPPSSRLISNNQLAKSGVLEIAPMEAPLALFVWGKKRIVPVRITEFSVTEEAFDPTLNPLRAKVSLGLRVLSIDDLGFEHKGGALYLLYQQEKERLATLGQKGALSVLGLGGIL
jgi:hypothetical protein